MAWAALESRDRAEPQVLELLDNTEEITELLRSTAEPAPEAPTTTGYPPPLVRERITLERAKKIYSVLRRPTQLRFQRDAHLWALIDQRGKRVFAEHPDGGWDFRTNHLGMREDEEVLEQAPDVRVLVTGDSHTAGLVPNSESFSNVLEGLLQRGDPDRSFEVLNAGVGGTALYHYLGVLEFLEPQLQPQVLVVALYGGNDFHGCMPLHRYYNHLGPPNFGPHGGPKIKDLPGRGPVGQVLGQAAYFLDNPEDRALARQAADSITVELERQCAEAGIELVFLHIPAATTAQPELYDKLLPDSLAALDMTREELAGMDEFAEHWLEFLEQRGLTYIDMQPIFESSAAPCYWFADLHINTHAHRLIAEELAALISLLE